MPLLAFTTELFYSKMMLYLKVQNSRRSLAYNSQPKEYHLLQIIHNYNQYKIDEYVNKAYYSVYFMVMSIHEQQSLSKNQEQV